MSKPPYHLNELGLWNRNLRQLTHWRYFVKYSTVTYLYKFASKGGSSYCRVIELFARNSTIELGKDDKFLLKIFEDNRTQN